MTFSDKLIALRKKAGWSQEELAERLNVSRRTTRSLPPRHRRPLPCPG